ncbi:pre-mRNA-splicing factor CWC22 homolog [Myzus persicae]|uniref:pre-mRNA-splicing factor CWC22 homolog n=1 Tax=Myzus persicae TaxID=13164 RepID=UPI000B93037A|nr:pre-mRNA-splicing factor CWC22 homolog [Myzus persicae]
MAAVFDIYSSDSDEPRPNMSAFLNRRRYYSKRNAANMTDFDKKNELSLSEQINDWNILRTSIESTVQKLNPGNIRYTCTKLFELNIIRGKGLLCRAIMGAQSNSLQFTHIYATLVSFINCEFPNIVELLLVRCVCLFTNAYKKCEEENKHVPPVIFIAHLVDNNVVKDWLVLDILKVLIKTPNLNAISMVDKIMKICGKKLNSNPHNKLDLKNIFDTLQNISEDEQIDKSVQCLAKVILLTKINYSEDEPEFYLVNPNKQFSHSLHLNHNYSPQYELDFFVYDLDFKSNEIIYKTYAKQILKLKSKVYYFANNDIDEMADDEDDCEAETNMLSAIDNVSIKKTISLLVNLKLPPSEIAHELMQFKSIPSEELELCIEYVECCFENSAVYNKIFGDIIQSFCQINPSIVDSIELIFKRCTPVIHLGNPNKLQNLAKFFAQLLCSDSISWKVFSAVYLTEYEVTYSGRAYLKALFNELISLMGRDDLKKRILDPSLQRSFSGLFPLNNRDNYRLCVHFFSDIGLYDVVVGYKESLSQGVAV